jgi:hypothetical protein
MLPSTLKNLEVEILQGRWLHGEEVRDWYPNGLENAIFKGDIYVPLFMKGLRSFFSLLETGKNLCVWSGE